MPAFPFYKEVCTQQLERSRMARSSRWHNRRRLSCFLPVAAIGLAVTQPAHAADSSATLVVNGKARSYAIHVPDRAPPLGGFPVILAFHGGECRDRACAA
jgi:poly(3-hydroxybutyrate) depolymerase